jgi:glycosyltransferase involved in cell wall biosynthesis
MKKILVGVPPKHHVLLSYDEINGLTDLGYLCKPVLYGRNDSSLGVFNKFLGVLRRAFNIVKELYAFRPDILYLNSRLEPAGSTRDFISVLVIRWMYFRKLKIAIKTHGSEPAVLQSQSFFYRRIVLPYLAKHINALFVLSNDEKETIRMYNKRLAEKVFVTANIVDPTRSVTSREFKRKYALPANKFKVLFVGRMVREKGVFSLLRSIPLLSDKGDCLFIFVGDGPDLAELKALAASMGLLPYTRFLGFIPDSECDHFYANADMLAFPTYCNEGFPMALFKSIAAGLPVITTPIRAAIDHLSAPENVLWVEKESPESIAEAITTLFKNRGLCARMSRNNRLKGKKFSRESVCTGMSEVILSI